MLINRKSIIQIVIVFCLFLSMIMLTESKTTFACDCAMPSNFTESLDNKDVVFDGVVIESSKDKRTSISKKLEINSADQVEWTFLVNGAWKGKVTEVITIVSKASSVSCGYEFEVGKRYAVFATSNVNDITVSSCSGTTTIADNSKIFEELGDYTVKLTAVTDNLETTDNEGATQIEPLQSDGTNPIDSVEKSNTTVINIIVIVIIVVVLFIVVAGLLANKKTRK